MRIRPLQSHPLAGLVIIMALVWLVIQMIVGIDYLTDRNDAYEGTVLVIRSSWMDHLTLEYLVVEHLIIETPDGQMIDKFVSVENRAFFRVQVGDYIVKERGFNTQARPVGKPTVQELLAAGSAALEAVGKSAAARP